jgi:hypothetical protein
VTLVGIRPVCYTFAIIASASLGQAPYGLDARAPIGPYLNAVMPSQAGEFAFPAVLSATGAFSDLATATPSSGIIPFQVNSPLWSDGAIKRRWLAVPNDGPPYTADEQIAFAPTGEWSFPNGTVFIKEFDLTINEATGERKRLETRFLVRDAAGAVYGVTYKWRADNSDADLLPGGLDEDITITNSSGQTRVQKWTYPSRSDCLYCHNQPANYVLGVKTHQLNGDFTYPSTGRTDNQLRTFIHLGLLNPAPREDDISTYLKSTSINNTTAPVQYRMRSWIDSNCSQCHRPGGFCPSYDARFYTPLDQQNLIDNFVKFRDLTGSELYQRDDSLGRIKMPPLAKNVVHEVAMANLRQWIASPLEVLSVHLYEDANHLAVKFNSRLDAETATVFSNYSLDQGAVVAAAMTNSDSDTVILTTSALVKNDTYTLTTNEIRDTAPSANTIWPGSRTSFTADFFEPSTDGRLANVSTRLRVGTGDQAAIAGFIVNSKMPKRLMIRAVGPSLAPRGITNFLADPILELHDSSGALVAANDNWADNPNNQEITDSTLAPASDSEAAILRRVAPGAYTAIVRGAVDATGVALLEVYDLDGEPKSGLSNISTRGLTQTGADVMIGGLIVQGDTPQKVILRAIGPSLPVIGKLDDPMLELRDVNGELLQSNDNWRSDQEAAIIATSVPPTEDAESALVRTLAPGAYTSIVRGVNETTGVALIEAYVLNN